MKVIHTHQYKDVPWKNGQGRTTEVAVYPEGSTTSDFLWRISIAHVGTSGPFSLFENVDRVIVQLSGPPMTLFHGDKKEEAHTLSKGQPYAFAGELDTAAELAGPCRDFNVMVRRDAFAAEVTAKHLAPGQERSFTFPSSLQFIYVPEGSLTVQSNDSEGNSVNLSEEGTLLLDGPPPQKVSIKNTSNQEAFLLLVSLRNKRRG